MPTPDPAGPVALVGAGALRDAIADALDRPGRGGAVPVGVADLAGPEALTGCSGLVIATDGWDASAAPAARAAAARAGLPWLGVHAELGSVLIGPIEMAGATGCAACAEARRERARPSRSAYEALWRRHGDELARRPSAWLTTLGCASVGALVADELDRAGHDPATARTHRAVLRLDLGRLTLRRHPFLPEPLCPVCGDLPDDAAELAVVELTSRPKPAPDVYRVRRVVDELERLTDTYVDPEAGLVTALRRDAHGGLVVAGAALPLGHVDRTEIGYGRSRSYRTSELTALLEALERWGGLAAGGKRSVVRGSYDQLASDALDPRTLGLHPAESYAQPGFPFEPFDPATACRWVWGYSFARRAPILVPEQYAYYSGQLRREGDPAFCYETSNGCALGSCLEEAILHGLLEVVERYAFLLTWYARLRAPRVDLGSARRATTPLLAAAITADTGYRIALFDITTDLGLPAVWALAVGPEGGPGPKALCAAASHLDPETAIANALSELGPVVADLRSRFAARAEHARAMLADPTLVVSMADHSTLYGAAEAFDRLRFLLDGTDRRDVADVAGGEPERFRGDDLRDDLTAAIGLVLDRGLDVVVVDQTTLEHRAGGFSCVKVVVPGTLAMTFGHANRRTVGLPRLRDVPALLGYRSGPLPETELNPHPHPFP